MWSVSVSSQSLKSKALNSGLPTMWCIVKLGIVEVSMEVVENAKEVTVVTCAGRMIGIASLVSHHASYSVYAY